MKDYDFAEQIWWLFVTGLFVALLTLIGGGLHNLNQPKEFKGYYLRQSTGMSSVWINWENRGDTRVFMSPDYNQTLEVYQGLVGMSD